MIMEVCGGGISFCGLGGGEEIAVKYGLEISLCLSGVVYRGIS